MRLIFPKWGEVIVIIFSLVITFVNIFLLVILGINSEKLNTISSVSKEQFYQHLKENFEATNCLPKYGSTVPDFRIEDYEGNKFSLFDLRNKFVIVYFLDYKIYSKDKMIRLSLAKKYANNDFIIMAVVPAERRVVQKAINKGDLRFGTLIIPDAHDEFRNLFKVKSNSNATVIISPEGKVIFSAYYLVGHQIIEKITDFELDHG